MAVNHLQNSKQAQKVLTIAFGLQPVSGHLCWSKTAGTSPTHQITAFNALGEGEWNACKAAFYRGINIPSSDFEFHPGALATGMTSGPQQVGTFFNLDLPHSRTATIGYKVPVGIGSPDTEADPPNAFEGIFETKKCPNFNSSGTQTSFGYTTNPARQVIELLQTYARLPNLPSGFASSAAYWLSRIDWGNWTEFRDFHETTETVDYTTIPDFKGFGLTVRFYTGTNFDSQIQKFVIPIVDFPNTSVAPAVGVNAASFSAEFNGFLKAPKTENTTFHFTHDNGVKFWIVPATDSFGSPLIDSWANDGNSTAGTHSDSYSLTADTFYKIKIHWNNGAGNSQMKFEWSSATQTQQVVPSQYLFPAAETHKKWESHVFIESPTSVGDGIRRILNQTNSIMQDVKGKLRFFCLDNLTSSFSVDNSSISSFKFRRRDILQAEPVTELEAEFKDVDHQYLNFPATPVSHKLEIFGNQSSENVLVIPLYNTTRWQARKLLAARAKMEYANPLLADLIAPMAKSYPVVAGDLITVTHRKTNNVPTVFLVRKSVDKGISDNRGQGKDIESRQFVVQEWS